MRYRGLCCFIGKIWIALKVLKNLVLSHSVPSCPVMSPLHILKDVWREWVGYHWSRGVEDIATG